MFLLIKDTIPLKRMRRALLCELQDDFKHIQAMLLLHHCTCHVLSAIKINNYVVY